MSFQIPESLSLLLLYNYMMEFDRLQSRSPRVSTSPFTKSVLSQCQSISHWQYQGLSGPTLLLTLWDSIFLLFGGEDQQPRI